MRNGEVWQLFGASGQLLGTLEVRSADMPWLEARFTPTPAFEAMRPLFEDELRLLDQLDEEMTAWEVAYRRIEDAVRLIAPGGRAVPEFLLHIDGAEAWWRWSDEPFTDPG